MAFPWLLLSVVFTLLQASLALAIEPQEVSKTGSLDDRSLQISDGSSFVPQDFYPEFSWDTTPLYYMFGDKNRTLRPEQVQFIAGRTGFLCIEKSPRPRPSQGVVVFWRLRLRSSGSPPNQ
jgi:hypothetical protein